MYTVDTKADKASILNGGWNTNNGILTAEEQTGAALFQSLGCNNCHAGNNIRGWNDIGWGDVGLDSVYTDNGLGNLTSKSTDNGVFKVPSLRNIALTAPYMHDGRYKTLEEVVEHYNSGVMYNSNLSAEFLQVDPVTYQPLQAAKRLNLTNYQKGALVAFFKTLTDYSLVADPKFSNPYKN